MNITLFDGVEPLFAIMPDIKRKQPSMAIYKTTICSVHFAALGTLFRLNISIEKPKNSEKTSSSARSFRSSPANAEIFLLELSIASAIKPKYPNEAGV
jgi:hypothetical protein